MKTFSRSSVNLQGARGHCCSQCGPQTSGSSMTKDVFRNTESQAPYQTCWMRSWSAARSAGDFHAQPSLRNTEDGLVRINAVLSTLVQLCNTSTAQAPPTLSPVPPPPLSFSQNRRTLWKKFQFFILEKTQNEKKEKKKRALLKFFLATNWDSVKEKI